MKKTKLLILFGGQSTEHEISCISAAAVLKNVDLERFEESEQLLNEAVDIYNELIENGNDEYLPDLANVYDSLGGLYAHWNKKQESEECYLKAIEIYEGLPDADKYNEEIADCKSRLEEVGKN